VSVRFACLLCSEEGQDARIAAELESAEGHVIVADLVGCVHARSLGHIGEMTFDQDWRLIPAALDVFERL
jgi:hypothetical protein